MKHLIPLLAFSFLVGCDGEKSNVAPSKDSPEEAFTESSYNKRIRLLFLLLILIVPCVAAQEKKSPLRTWTSDIGTKIEAELVSLADGEVTLKTKTGRTLKVPLKKLSKADQEFAAAKSSPKKPTKEAVSLNPKLIEIPVTDLRYEIESGSVTITKYTNYSHALKFAGTDHSGHYLIPEQIEGKPVTRIGKYSFLGFGGGLTHITIPDSVTSIEQDAFKSLRNLASITIGKSVTSIGHRTFYSSERLRSVIFLGDAPDDVGVSVFVGTGATIFRKPEAKGWGDTFADRPVKLITEKP